MGKGGFELMIVAGVVIDLQPDLPPDQSAALLADLRATAGMTKVEGPVTPGRLAAVIEAKSEAAVLDLCDRIIARSGVVNVNPAFIQFDVQEESRA